MNKIRQTLAIASILGTAAMLESLDSPRRRKPRSEHTPTTKQGDFKRARKKRNKQSKKSRKQNR
jgi:hypothetical protein